MHASLKTTLPILILRTTTTYNHSPYKHLRGDQFPTSIIPFLNMVYAPQNETNPIKQLAYRSNDTMARAEVSSLHNISIKLRVRRPTSPASSQSSAEGRPLFMSPKAARRNQRSLSPTSNRALRKKIRQSEPNNKTRHDDPASENMAWEVINREISEWQNVCQTGRPSWWSPASNWTQGGARSTRQEEGHAIPLWRRNPDHVHRPWQRYDKQRRAVTDSYLTNENKVQDLAHLIAVQLLSACFTLPPEHISSCTSSAYHCFDTPSPSEVPDSRLISSLRMHTEARYSPSFGHQARNTSPVYRWQGPYDGPSRPRSRESSSGHQSSDTETSRETSRKRRIHRALHVTEGSTAKCSIDSHLELYDLSDILPNVSTTAWHDQKVDSPTVLDRNIKSCPSTPSEFDAMLLHSSRLATGIFRGHTPEALQTRGCFRIPDQLSRQTLQSVIRSEPHHIYIQPVKELVIKRWRSLRQRFGYGLGYFDQDPVNRANAISSVSASLRSTPAEGSFGSPALSSDGKERRRQGRESGNIHSNSIESNPRYNTPTSTVESGVTSPELLEHPFPDIAYAQSLRVAKAIANDFSDSGLAAAVSLCFTPLNSQTSSSIPSLSAAITGSLNSKTDSGHVISPTKSNSKPLHSPPTSSMRRHGQRRHQRSNLSEICTPGDMEERSVLSGFGSPLAKPKEESGSEAAGELPSKIPKLEMEGREPIIGQILHETIESCPEQDENPRLEPQSGKLRRPSIVRTSTSGTQVFTPSEDGVELDGLPTGPPSETWDDQGQGKKELSFL
jgi:hypothetical protein